MQLVDEDRPLTVEFGASSATTLLMEELGGIPFGAPPAWRAAAELFGTAPARRRGAPPVRDSGPTSELSLRSCPTGPAPGSPTSARTFERIAAIPPDSFAAQLPGDGSWDDVARRPARWLEGFAAAIARACDGLRGQWRDAAGLLDAEEAERVGVAAVRGAERELLAARFGAALLRLDELPHGAELRPRLGMVPMLAEQHGHVWVIDGELAQQRLRSTTPGGSWTATRRHRRGFEGLLGAQRARILGSIARPASVGSRKR